MNSKILCTVVTTALLTGLGTTIFSEQVLSEETAEGITVTIEEPGIQAPQLSDPNEYFVVDFNNQDGTDGFEVTNNNTVYSYGNDLEVKAADQWGGANGSKFITQEVLQSIRSYSLTVSEDQKYFGFWWSAGDPYNQITFKNDGREVASFKTADLVNFINSYGTVQSSAYYGNPAYSGDDTGHLNEPFSFVNVFFGEELAYDEVVVATLTANGAAFESDNHTFSAISQEVRGIPINTAPVANTDEVVTVIRNTIAVDVLANDTDKEGHELTLKNDVNDDFSGGRAIVENNKIVYTAGLVPGEFSMTYTVEDEYGISSEGKVNITVVASPD